MIMTILSLALLLTPSLALGDVIWTMRIHKGVAIEEHSLVDIDSLTFHSYEYSHPVPMVLVPHGTFEMGDGVSGCGMDEHLVTLTNDAWYGMTSAPYQHLSMVTFRAVENRVFIVRAANTGISAIIDATGKIRSATEIFTKGFVVETIRSVKLDTFYSEFGDIFAQICLGITLTMILREVIKSVSRRSRKV